MRFTRKLLPPIILMLCVAACSSGNPDSATASGEPGENVALTTDSASRFAELALDCMHREYPNKLGQVLKDETGLLPPKTLHPAFYGCFDWHSAVHGHWLLVRLLHLDAPGLDRQAIIAALDKSFTEENLKGEVAYFSQPQRKGFERPYGRAWFLALAPNMPLSLLLQNVGAIDPGEPLYPSTFAVYLGMVSMFLPFVALPLYTAVEKMDWALVEAAHDLYASRWRVFRHAILPQTMPGLSVGITLTLVPAMGMFVVPDMLGGSRYMLIGNLIQQQFGTSRNWPLGAALSLVLMLLTLSALMASRRRELKKAEA